MASVRLVSASISMIWIVHVFLTAVESHFSSVAENNIVAPIFWHLIDDFLNLINKTHIQHSSALSMTKKRILIGNKGSPFNMIHYPARGSHHHMGFLFQLFFLPADRWFSIKGWHLNPLEAADVKNIRGPAAAPAGVSTRPGVCSLPSPAVHRLECQRPPFYRCRFGPYREYLCFLKQWESRLPEPWSGFQNLVFRWLLAAHRLIGTG